MSGLAAKAIASVQRYRQQAVGLLLYQSVLETPVSQALLSLLDALCREDSAECLIAYGVWFRTLAERQQTWQAHLIEQILQSENPFSQQAQRLPVQELPTALLNAARSDLRRLQTLFTCQSSQLSQWVQTVCQIPDAPVIWYLEDEPAPDLTFVTLPDWQEGLVELATLYRQRGAGIVGQYQVFRWRHNSLDGVPHPDPVRLADLAAYGDPRKRLLHNTQFLLAGYPALHVLLYGSRGSGKSSLVKALVNEYGDRGLRLIQVDKAEMIHLPAVVERVRDLPQKFIIFVDDLSFEEDDDAFKALKVVLEGNVTARATNTVVYATSNRRHLVREYFADRPRPSDQDEIQSWDTVQEKLSFSDRFGLTLTFEAADQKTYLAIVQHLAANAKLTIDPEDLKYRALQWATRHNGRSGRTARQFIDFLTAELATAES
ncbi:ATP-binding protein [Oscillatoria sp. CS-180]|uniref:ATP-binding protein n=1 Tax=Oscillatoria sp. CS-180 TaxID=3021720 RepID=UPI00232CB8F3|nr:ATP-binding protein [Oscillatoria sp. CS-180]MDB9526905.1 ATP-binding protein [Oscillatoria sp. CS-180]